MTNSKYKVIKPFASVLKGEELENTFENFYEFTASEGGNTRYLGIDVNTAEDLCKKGYLTKVEENCNCGCDDCNKEVKEYINDLLYKYDVNLKDAVAKAEKGEIPQCVKVEAETVYYNLTKVLQEILNRLS